MADVRAPDYKDPRDEAATPPPKDRTGLITPVLEPNEARQGATHHNVRYVLAIGLGAAIVAMAIAYFIFFPTMDPMEDTSAPPAGVTAPPPQSAPSQG